MATALIAQVTGAGSGRCSACHGTLDYSWWVTFTDGTKARLCSVDLAAQGQP